MALVGEAEITIVANTAGFEAQLAASSDPALAGLEGKAATAGEDTGAALSTGLSTGAKDIGKDTESALKDSTGRMSGLVGDFGKKASSSLESLGVPASLLTGPAILGVGLAAAGAIAIKMAMDMQTADATIATSSGISAKAATAIGDAFLGTAGKTEFSGQAMATAFGAVAGQLKSTNGSALTTKQSLDFMKASMDLATASGQDLGTTTSTLATTMQAFKLPVSDAAAASNVLFNVGNATGQSMDTVGAALDKLKSRLGTTSPSLGALGALMVDLTNNGITGRASLTVLNGATTALANTLGKSTSTTKLTIDTLKQFGVSATTSSGQLTPMSTIIDKLGPKFATMTQAQQLAAATNIFGASAAKGMITVIDAGSASYDKATAAVINNNNVQDAAATKAQTMAVEFSTVKASLEDVGTTIGEDLMPIIQKLMPVLGTLVTAVGTLLTGAFQVLQPVIDVVITVIQQVVTIFTQLIDFIVDVFTGQWAAAWQAIETLFDDLWTFIEGWIGKLIPIFESIPGELLSALGDLTTFLFGQLEKAGDWIYNHAIVPVIDWFKKLPGLALSALGDLVVTIFKGLLDVGSWIDTNVIMPVVDWFKKLPSLIVSGVGNLASTFTDMFKDAATWLVDAGEKIMEGLLNGITSGLSKVKDFVGHIASDLVSWKGPPAVDAVLLTNNGQLIMQGLADGLSSGYSSKVMPLVSGMGAGIKGSIGASGLGTGTVAGSSGAATHQITISAGAIVINPSPGNDAASLAATQVMVENAFDQLLSEILAGSTPLTAVSA